MLGWLIKNKLLEFINNGCKPILDESSPVRFYINGSAAVRYRKDREQARNILSVLRGFGTTETSKTELKKKGIYFDYPKPVNLLKYLLQIGCEFDKEIVVDFFSGSGSTAEAIYNLNAEENKNRRFILIQLPEETKPSSAAYGAGYKNIFEITKSRVV